jgi:hypothetical protein
MYSLLQHSFRNWYAWLRSICFIKTRIKLSKQVVYRNGYIVSTIQVTDYYSNNLILKYCPVNAIQSFQTLSCRL